MSYLPPPQRRLRHVVCVSVRNILPKGGHPRPVSTKSSTNLRELSSTSKNAGTLRNVLYDTFISFHECFQYDKPFYITEISHGTINPVFQDVHFAGTSLSRKITFSMMVWVRESKSKNDWVLFKRINLKLSFLNYLGPTLEKAEKAVKDVRNILLLNLVDGWYYYPLDSNLIAMATDGIQSDKLKTVKSKPSFLKSRELKSCSFDQIIKLSNVKFSIIDTIGFKHRLSIQIDHLISSTFRTDSAQQIEAIKHRLVYQYAPRVEMLSRENTSLQNVISKLRTNCDRLRSLIKNKNTDTEILAKVLHSLRESHGSLLVRGEEVQEYVSIQKSRLIKDLSSIFNITQTNGKHHEHCMFGLIFPHAKISSSNFQFLRSQELEINALLGYVVQLVHLLATYLRCPLRYPIQAFGSNSYISDPISRLKGSRVFPLWIKDGTVYRFQYAIMLLTKNVKQLMDHEKIKSIEAYHLLGNLQILFVCLTNTADSELNFKPKLDLEQLKIHLHSQNTQSLIEAEYN
ncbi:hypothetical protein LJB42_001364 [Komagataella kurtzmanii]|nr:hypothetical protein LJB42_001364 [Komagataella kurtzmanii]